MNDIAPMPRRRGRPPKYPRPDTVYGLKTASGDNRGVTNYANSLPSYLGGGGPTPTQNGPAGGYAPRGYPTSTPSRSSGQPYPTRNAQGGYGQLQGTYPQMASSSQRNGPLPPYGQSSSNLPPGPPQPPVYYRPNSFPEGPLGFFLAPPGQASLDPLLSTPPSAQALYSTYGSRLRTGVTGLMQPETITGGPRERELFLAELDREVVAAKGGNSGASTPRPDSPAPPYSAKRPALQSTLSGRRTGRGGAVSYVEKESEDEDEEDDEDDAEEDDDVEEAASDPEDADYGARGGRRRTDRVRSHDLLPGRGSVGVNETQASARAGKLKKRKDELDRGWTWLGDRAPGERVRSKAFKGTHHLYASVEALAEEADQPEHLVPVVIDFDVQSLNPEQPGIKLKDRFLWNINERFVTPKQFALTFCDDVGIPAHYAATIAELIQTQLDEARNLAAISVVDPDVTEDDVVWSEEEKEEESHIEEATTEIEGENEAEAMEVDGKVSAAATPQVEVDEEEAEEEQEDVYVHKVWPEADCRIVINLDVQIYAHILRDRIEWDLSSALPPSVFAKHYCSEIGLTGEAIPLVAHAIIDEILKHKKDALDLQLFRDSHPNEQAKHEKAPGAGPKTTSRTGAQPLLGVWRDWWEREDFGPVLIELSMEEMERREMERTREARRMMRTLAGSKRRR